MKSFFTIFLLLHVLMVVVVVVACRQSSKAADQPVTFQYRDTCSELTRVEMLEGRIALLENLAAKRKLELDSVNNKLFIASYKVERVRFYLNICLRNASQDKFLKGWVKRAIE